jgi:Cytochrome C biogenesis protein transmembrane region
MLGSINPLGERGRHSKWIVTVTAFVVASVSAGSVLGAALGVLGTVTVDGVPAAVRAGVVVTVLVAGAVWDAWLARRGLPRLSGPRRQVNEDWLRSYRGWVYGLAFGFQLGLGVATIVSTAAVYAALAAAYLTGSVAGGLAVGTSFGLARALPLLAGGRIRQPGDLLRLDAALRRWDPRARRTAIVLQAAVAVAACGALAVR